MAQKVDTANTATSTDPSLTIDWLEQNKTKPKLSNMKTMSDWMMNSN